MRFPLFFQTIIIVLQLHYLAIARSQVDLASLKKSLPPPLAFWPLNSKFGTSDANAADSRYDGMKKSPSVVLSKGPFKNLDSSYALGADNSSYLEFSAPEFDLSQGSFTISMLAKVSPDQDVAPLIEFPNENPGPNDPAFGFNMWMWPNRETLLISSMNAGEELRFQCSFHYWAFVGIVYNSKDNTMQAFCNYTVSEKIQIFSEPLTKGAKLVIGKSMPIADRRKEVHAVGKVSSLSIYREALERDGVKKVFKLAQKYAEEPCQSASCLPETCKSDEATTTGFTCECKSAGGSRTECLDYLTTDTSRSTSIVTETTSTTATFNSTSTVITTTTTDRKIPSTTSSTTSTIRTTTSTSTTILPATATDITTDEPTFSPFCEEGWTGVDCQIPICTPACQEGDTCIGVNECQAINRILVDGAETEKVLEGGSMKREHMIILIVAIVLLVIILIGTVCAWKRRSRYDEVPQEDPTAVVVDPVDNTQPPPAGPGEAVAESNVIVKSEEYTTVADPVSGKTAQIVTNTKRDALLSDA